MGGDNWGKGFQEQLQRRYGQNQGGGGAGGAGSKGRRWVWLGWGEVVGGGK